MAKDFVKGHLSVASFPEAAVNKDIFDGGDDGITSLSPLDG
eukprot:CAMPEP_0170793518 /NCGR_PEP_ID=MMETSP0733-20121128/22726_1 /TAXON_ID=186038 /ORGANISM="Fragilariopsis kerguelensis, Strain L26-C5" /LENGTH=40 /DNA_ID= /DNA_START= /DNA_END= /DNA_ORIENTATION=